MDSSWICYKSLLASPTDQGDSQRLRCPVQGASVVTNPQTYVIFWHSIHCLHGLQVMDGCMTEPLKPR